jgi:S-adenosylmethionine decarboxylase
MDTGNFTTEKAEDAMTADARDPIGRHLLADLWQIAPAVLSDKDELSRLLARALDRNGFTTVGKVAHAFPGDGSGITVVYLLAQSHASIHTYPELGYLALDVFSCGAADPERVLGDLAAALHAGKVDSRLLPRGEP